MNGLQSLERKFTLRARRILDQLGRVLAKYNEGISRNPITSYLPIPENANAHQISLGDCNQTSLACVNMAVFASEGILYRFIFQVIHLEVAANPILGVVCSAHGAQFTTGS